INYSALDNMDELFDTKPIVYESGSPAPIKSVFEEPGLVRTPVRSRQSSMGPSREGSARPGRLASVSRMIKSKTGNSVKFSSTPAGSRTVSREQSMQARSLATNGSRENDEDEDEIIAPPKSRTRAEEEEVVEAEEEEEELPDQSWGAMMGYRRVEEDEYNYNDMGDDW
ncbi:hypothetical protein BGZ91_001395, partial [Linnemannia elongata]